MATALKELKLDDAHATAIMEKAIEYKSYNEDMPASKRERIKAASDQIVLMIDAWNDDEEPVTPDSDNKDVAAMGVILQDIFEIAGVEIDGDGEVTYYEPPELEDAPEDDNGAAEGEAAFDINDYIKEYDDLAPASKVKAITKLELDMEDDDDYNTAVAIYEYENAQDKPSSRVLSYLDDVLPPEEAAAEGEAEDEDAEAADEDAEAEGDEAESEDGGWEEPWDRYDKQTAVEVKKHLDKLMAKDELSSEMAQYVIDYETAREKPPTRSRIVDHAAKLMAVLDNGEAEGEADEEPQEEERAARPSRTTRTRAGRSRASRDPDESEDADEAVARDDERESRRRKPAEDEELTEEDLLEMVPGGLAAAFVNARMHDKALSVAGLGEPSDWDGDMPELPEDIAAEDHDTLSNLLGDFASCLSTSTWNAAKAYIEHGFYDQVVDYLESVALLESEESSEQKRKADAATQPAVVTAKALAQIAYSDYVRFRELGKTLKIRHATVSRVGGFMGEETEAEDQSEAPRTSTRGTARGSDRGSSRGGQRARSRR